MTGRTVRAAVILFFVMAVASCGQLFARESPQRYSSAHTVGELCRYPLDFFANQLRRPGLEVIEPTSEPDREIGGFGGCTIYGPKGGLSSLFVSVSLEQADNRPVEGLTADYKEREAIQVGADTVRVWSRDDGMGRELRVDVDGWIGHLTVILHKIGEPTGDTALPDEHLPAAAEMLVQMTRDLKGSS